jgi:hypothetical protein
MVAEVGYRFILFRCRSFARRWRRRYRQIARAAYHAPGISLAFTFGGMSLVLYVLPELDLALWYGVSLGAGAFLASFMVGGIAALSMLAPGEYAQIVLSGRPVQEVFFSIADRAQILSVRFSRGTRGLRPLMQALFETAKKHTEATRLEQEDEIELRRIVETLRRQWALHLGSSAAHWTIKSVRQLLTGKHRHIRRVEAMKLLAAQELDIPARRLCDHIFQFSPTMFEYGVRTYLRNLDEMQAAIRTLRTPQEIAKFCGQVRQNFFLDNWCLEKVDLLESLIVNESLHRSLRQLASVHSTSGSLQVYARALRDAGRTDRDRGGEAERNAVARRRLWFLYRKQRARPGFDVHYLLRTLLEDDADLCRLLDDVASPPPEKPSLPESARRLGELPTEVQKRLVERRARLAHLAGDLYRAWAIPGTRQYIVTHGYSKTVREVLRACFGEDAGSPGYPEPRVFLLSTEDPQAEFDARLMKVELRQCLGSRELSIAAGSVEFLCGLLKRSDQLLIMLGAESFDADRRVVHPRTAAAHVERLLKQARCPHLCVVVAESYKRLPGDLTASTFFADHFDRVSIYDSSLVDFIVSDDGIEPPDWADKVKRWLIRPRVVGRLRRAAGGIGGGH